jgi:beta-lactam-binding protein with PASTA domain
MRIVAGVGVVLAAVCLQIAGSSSSAHMVVVPTVVGDGVEVAYSGLRYEGLAVWIDEPIDLGASIARQSPAPGRRVRPGAVVALELEQSSLHGMLPWRPEPIKMPRLLGKRLDVATGRLNALGLLWNVAPLPPLPPSTAPSLLANYRVREQRPAAGREFLQTVLTPIPEGIRSETTPVGLEATLRFRR